MYDIQFAATAILSGEGEPELDDVFRSLAEAGYAGVELDAKWIEEASGVEEIRELCYRHQIAPVSALIPGARGADAAYVSLILDHLDELGAEHLVLSHPDESVDAVTHASNAVGEMIISIADTCSELGLKISYLPSALDLRESGSLSNGLLASTPPETVGLALDYRSLAEGVIDVIGNLYYFKSRINYLRISGSATSDEELLTLEKALEAAQFTGWGVVEHSEHHLPAGPEELKRLKKAFNV